MATDNSKSFHELGKELIELGNNWDRISMDQSLVGIENLCRQLFTESGTYHMPESIYQDRMATYQQVNSICGVEVFPCSL